MLQRSNPEHAEELMAQAQRDIDNRWHLYEQMVHVERSAVYGVYRRGRRELQRVGDMTPA